MCERTGLCSCGSWLSSLSAAGLCLMLGPELHKAGDREWKVMCRLEPISMNWTSTRVDWKLCPFFLPLPLVMRVSWRSWGPSSWGQTHTSSLGSEVKENPGEGKAGEDEAATACQGGELADQQRTWAAKWLLFPSSKSPKNLPCGHCNGKYTRN